MKLRLMVKALLFFAVLWNLSAYGAVGVHFFKSPNSLFPSGQAPIEALNKNTKKQEFLYSFLVENNRNRIWIPSSVAAIDLFLAEKVIYQNTPYILKDTHDSWALIQRVSDEHRTWAPLAELKPQLDDLGAAITLTATSLKSKASWASNTILSLAANTRLFILGFEDTWLKVRFESGGQVTGFVDMNTLLLKSDFANEALLENGRWVMVKHRLLDKLVTNSDEAVAIEKVKAYRTDSRRLITLKAIDEQNVLLRQSFHILEINAQTWFQSEMPGHGLVSWTKPPEAKVTEDHNFLSYSDLLKREITSVSWHPTNPKHGLISAGGIFYTLDGEKWRKIRQFKKENHPVAIFPDGTWIVGGYRTNDPTAKFKPYVRWDYLAKLIQNETKKAPKSLKIAKVDFTAQKRFQLTLDSGSKKIVVATKSNEEIITDWQLLY